MFHFNVSSLTLLVVQTVTWHLPNSKKARNVIVFYFRKIKTAEKVKELERMAEEDPEAAAYEIEKIERNLINLLMLHIILHLPHFLYFFM